MRYDAFGLWQVNFQKELGASKKIDYVMSRQLEQVFFYPNDKEIVWRTILHDESRSTRVLGDYIEVDFHDTMDDNAKYHVQLVEACDARTESGISTAPTQKREFKRN